MKAARSGLKRRFPRRRRLHRAWALTALAGALCTLAVPGRPSAAAELRLRPTCSPAGPIVTLGDVAEIIAADASEASRLSTTELFVAPSPGQTRYLSARELQDLLILRGFDLRAHRCSGAAQVAISAALPTATSPLSPQVARRAERRVADAIAAHLASCDPSNRDLLVECSLDQSQARRAAEPTTAVRVEGGAPPWVGPQRFTITLETPQGPTTLSLEAEVRRPPAVVVAVRSIGRGQVVRADDVAVEPLGSAAAPTGGFGSIEEVVGLETTRAVPAGSVIDRETVRAPLLVRRGDVVTVYARSGSVRVRTTARARDDASAGEVVSVESLADRSTYLARVSGIREVEVFAHSPRAESSQLPAATAMVEPLAGGQTAR